MPTPKQNPKILSEWTKNFSEHTAQGMKKSKAYNLIAQKYGVSYTAVRYHLNPQFRNHQLSSNRKRYHQKIWVRKYNRNYRRLTRTPDKFLSYIFDLDKQTSLDEITVGITELAEGVQFRSSTVERLLNKYIHNKRGPPFLERVSSYVYRIRDKQA